MENGINVLSTFNGMGCIWLALDDAGIKVNKRYSSEIDKYANQANDAMYPDTIQLGDVTKIDVTKLEKIDLFVGGSPCQGFSFAGKQLNFDDPRSALFFEYVKIWNKIKKINPEAKFLLENVNMKKEYLRVISEYLGVFPVRINSNLVSAQNRDRWYWTNIKTKDVGLFSELWTDIPQPEDKGILLKDILQPESEIDEKYYMSNTMINWLEKHKEKRGTTIKTPEPDMKASCLTSANYKQNLGTDYIKVDKKGNKKADQSKAICLTAGGNSGGNHSDMDIICVSMVGRKLDENGTRKDSDPNIKAEQQLEPNTNGKTNCLTSVQKDKIILQRGRGNNKRGLHKEKSPTLTSNSFEQNNLVVNQNYIQCNDNGHNSQSNRFYFEDSKAPRLGAGNAMKTPNIINEYRLRRLTPRECGRLQTVPEDKLNIMLNCGVSDTQLYKMFGNGWTVKVISHILSFMK